MTHAHDDLKVFLATYRHEGAKWALELKARDFEDAQARLAKLSYATLDGELVAKVPAVAGPFVVLAAAIRNSLSRLANVWPSLSP